MKPSQMNDKHRKLILDRVLSDTVLAERLGMAVREVKRQRARMLVNNARNEE